MKTRIFLELLLGFLAVCGVAISASLFFAAPAHSQDMPDNCTARVNAIENLRDKYQEERVMAGVTNSGAMMELFHSAEGDTWTLVMSNASGVTCFVSAGEGLRFVKPQSTDPGA